MIIWDIKKDTVDKYYTISVLHSSIFSQISEKSGFFPTWE